MPQSCSRSRLDHTWLSMFLPRPPLCPSPNSLHLISAYPGLCLSSCQSPTGFRTLDSVYGFCHYPFQTLQKAIRPTDASKRQLQLSPPFEYLQKSSPLELIYRSPGFTRSGSHEPCPILVCSVTKPSEMRAIVDSALCPP